MGIEGRIERAKKFVNQHDFRPTDNPALRAWMAEVAADFAASETLALVSREGLREGL